MAASAIKQAIESVSLSYGGKNIAFSSLELKHSMIQNNEVVELVGNSYWINYIADEFVSYVQPKIIFYADSPNEVIIAGQQSDL